jgi:hypothetical protein
VLNLQHTHGPKEPFETFLIQNLTDNKFSFFGSKDADKMGAKIFLTVKNGTPVEIHTSCSKDIYVNMVFGEKYRITEGVSLDGGPLCDAPSVPPTEPGDCGECKGQITFLELEYIGGETEGEIKIYEGKVEDKKGPKEPFEIFYI